ncbi:D-alanyl-D-alanine carboxypeptidase [Streptomyces parvulus]|uniref:D-alanyl-D-alanine carboxypeptidase n=1 Tax=Streptomyces parvulus TaxID=146923 RepID=UPI001E65843E|nr:D-alanyl-D-alanine carboxypeptidase [Streptomyces parvulus]MCC9157884.1 D-alanyl-D-alanine carboxypeptidase [Streptomyces parvulus]MCE7690070.1 D-alanyl-D-alanine carboxypeptidase [Streptomyces parvulus]
MEEASVAGESPDRSKQRESSEEPTSGSAGPVPEARTEASERRDPRLAVTREGAKSSASAGSDGSEGPRGGVDTATRVLSARETEAETDTEADAETASETETDAETESPVEETERADEADGPEADVSDEADESSEEDTGADGKDAEADADADAAADTPAKSTKSEKSSPVDDSDDSDSPGDGRLRDAVAAWVATADERAAANARLEAPETTEETTAAQEPPEAPEKAAEAEGGDSEDAPDDSAPDADAGTDDERPVDQPTAVFQTRPAKPSVDQPTTMLKLGDVPPVREKSGKTDKAAESDKADKADEPRDVERTSKFVALRHLDDPATRKPPGAPKAPAEPTGPAEPAERPQALRNAPTAAVPQVGPERTTQQPVPPKPPLDLLAELTNTPPPPETPLRTTVRRVKIWTPLVVLLLIVFAVAQSMRPLPAPTLDLTAEDSFTFEGGKPDIPWPSSGQAALDVQGIGSFGSSGDQKPVPIASVAKVMTAYVILRDHPLKSGADGPKIKIDQAAEDQSQAGQESTVNVFEGDSISQREALESILIASANNVARLLARWDAGSEKAFVEKMNAAAEDLGMTNSTYTDPSGLNNTTVSTAVDQVKLAKAAMTEPAFREVAAMMSYDDYKGVNHSNWNHLVGHNDVVGIKTGTTTSALGNLVFAAKKDVDGETRTIVGAVVRQPAGGADNTILGAALDSSDKLIRAAQDTLESSTIVKKGTVVGYVDDGLGGRTPVVATQDVKAVGWAGLTVKLTFKADEVPHTAKAGTKVGTLAVGDGGSSGAVKVPVALRDDLAEPGFADKLTRVG